MEPFHSFTSQQRSEIERFVRRWYKLAPAQAVSPVDSDAIDLACYRKLVFRAQDAPLLTLYLAPDGKHLVSEVTDLGVDPAIAQHEQQEDLNAQLTFNAVLMSPEGTAPIKLVMFSDFQCPYSKQFSEIMHELTSEERAELQIIYRQRPLNIHSWARDAAELTECVGLRDRAAFWKLHDFLFARQGELSKETLQSKSLDFLSRETTLSPNVILACLNDKGFEGPLRYDEQLASDLGINATPSVFVNGRRTDIYSIKDPRTALRMAISEAKKLRPAHLNQ